MNVIAIRTFISIDAKKEPKPCVLAPLAPPGRFELPTFRLGGERCYPAELRRLIHDIQFFCNPCRAALLPLRRRPLYPTELRGHVPGRRFLPDNALLYPIWRRLSTPGISGSPAPGSRWADSAHPPPRRAPHPCPGPPWYRRSRPWTCCSGSPRSHCPGSAER